jgi:pimeloyl-ACP methyl ester carboxylesterase
MRQAQRRVVVRIALVAAALIIVALLYATPFALKDPALHPFSADVSGTRTLLVLVHGLGSTPASMLEMQERLEMDGLYVNGQALFRDSTMCAYAKRTGKPMSFAVTFYPPTGGSPLDQLSTALSRTVVAAKGSRTLDLYKGVLASQLRQAMACANASQLDVIAYSMGGLIVREVLPNITGVRRVVFLGTPQRPGIYGNKTLELGLGATVQLGDINEVMKECKQSSGRNIIYSTLTSTDLSQECQVLEYALLLRDTNQTEMLAQEGGVIAGNTDGRGDGLIELNATLVPGVQEHTVACEHNALRSPQACPQAYGDVVDMIGGGQRTLAGFQALEGRLLLAKIWLRRLVTGD